jgi:dCMP deaminase
MILGLYDRELADSIRSILERWGEAYDGDVYDNGYSGPPTPHRPAWDDYFLNLAFEVAKRSNDPQTQHGTVLVSQSNEIIATGYNGHIRDIKPSTLPNLRPDKYDWMIHSEPNAILSCARQGKSTLNAKAYVTGPPCLQCLQFMWQAGIVEIIHGETKSHMMQDKETEVKIEIFKELTKKKLKIRSVNFIPKS